MRCTGVDSSPVTGSELFHTIVDTLGSLALNVALPGIVLGIGVALLYAVLRGMRWIWEHSR